MSAQRSDTIEILEWLGDDSSLASKPSYYWSGPWELLMDLNDRRAGADLGGLFSLTVADYQDALQETRSNPHQPGFHTNFVWVVGEKPVGRLW